MAFGRLGRCVAEVDLIAVLPVFAPLTSLAANVSA